jgi:hypothetical protein
MESIGDMTVSMGPFHEKIVIGTGRSNSALMESIGIPSFFKIR